MHATSGSGWSRGGGSEMGSRGWAGCVNSRRRKASAGRCCGPPGSWRQKDIAHTSEPKKSTAFLLTSLRIARAFARPRLQCTRQAQGGAKGASGHAPARVGLGVRCRRRLQSCQSRRRRWHRRHRRCHRRHRRCHRRSTDRRRDREPLALGTARLDSRLRGLSARKGCNRSLREPLNPSAGLATFENLALWIPHRRHCSVF